MLPRSSTHASRSFASKTRTKSLFPEPKLVFLERRLPQYKEARREGSKAVSAFFDKVTCHFLSKFGREQGVYDAPPEPEQQAADEDAWVDGPDSDADEIDQVEADRRNVTFDETRGVMSAWFRNRARSANGQQPIHTEIDALFDDLFSASNSKPRKLTGAHMYSKIFYLERIKADFTRRFKLVQEEATHLGSPVPNELYWRGVVTRELWEMETEEVRQEVEEQVLKHYKLALEAWELGLATNDRETDKPHDVDAAASILQPLADTLSHRCSARVCIFIAGPTVSSEGIQVRSAHAGKTTGYNPRIWPQYDPSGFGKAQASFTEFARVSISFASSGGPGMVSITNPSTNASTGSVGDNGRSSGSNDATMSHADEQRTSNDDTPQASASTSDGALSRAAAAIQFDERPPAPLPDDSSTSNASAPSRASILPTERPPGLLGDESNATNADAANADGDGVAQSPADNPSNDEDSNGVDHQGDEDARPREKLPPYLGDTMEFWKAEGTDAWGKEWCSCIDALLEYERSGGFVEADGRLPSEGRPFQIADWMQAHRLNKFHTIPLDLSFYRDLLQWWRNLQPADRTNRRNQINTVLGFPDPTSSMESWKSLNHHGSNGVYLFIVGLGWFGNIVFNLYTGSDLVSFRDRFSELAEDVAKVLKCLTTLDEACETDKAPEPRRSRSKRKAA
ncbi:hypothetical protein HGRIS_005402 [Hohenbuehelia grisea]|uniref:Uncharacterized protein n=1 Tax=Hohenbuehelia grisea TaxID=104357 RepID=A0ABR3JEZ0_9AGAR